MDGDTAERLAKEYGVRQLFCSNPSGRVRRFNRGDRLIMIPNRHATAIGMHGDHVVAHLDDGEDVVLAYYEIQEPTNG